MVSFKHGILGLEHYSSSIDSAGRLSLEEALATAIEAAPGEVALLEMDTDNLKAVNDELGHPEGDKYIAYIRELLKDTLRNNELFLPIHKSGDEFSVILYGVSSDEGMELIKKRIQEQLAEYGVEMSIGGRVHRDGETIETLLAAADALLIEDKNARTDAMVQTYAEKFAIQPPERTLPQEIEHIADVAGRYGISASQVARAMRLSKQRRPIRDTSADPTHDNL